MRWGKPTKNNKRKDPRYFLKESSLSRVYEHVMAHDTAGITAFRDNPFDGSKCTDRAVGEETEDMQEPLDLGSKFTKVTRPEDSYATNLRRNKELKAALLQMGYGVTKVDGSYIEGFKSEVAREVKEDSFMVVNLKDDPSFQDNIKMLGERFCQDSVLIVPKGGKGAYLYGTNNNEYPGYGKIDVVGDFKGGKEAEFMSRVGGRPYAFNEKLNEEIILETLADHGRNSRWVIRKISDRILNKLS